MFMKSSLCHGAFALLAIFAIAPAQAEIAIVVNPNNPVTHMDHSQVAQFFIGGSNNLKPVEYTDSAPIRAEFCKKVLERTPSQVRAMWARIVFSSAGKAPQELKSGADVKKVISQSPNAIGYIEKSEVDDSVKVIAVVE
ncbi:hypothetical protein [Massilia putida]|uniref:hypothetical protein n=1 Tax=Massilia putida TaxID=1141883 RepID=UPI001E4E089E|nr:hypothetical protein [Massilia putida]